MKKISLCLVLVLFAATISAATIFMDIPESSSIRGKLTDTWFTENTAVLAQKQPETFSNEAGEVFQVRYDDTECVIIVAPEQRALVRVYTDREMVEAVQKTYPACTPGSWELYLDRTTSSPVCVRYYFAGDSDVYVQFRRGSKGYASKSLADFVVFGEYAARNIATGIMLEQLFTMSLADVMELTKQKLPWIDSTFYTELYEGNQQMSAVIREKLDCFEYADYAVYDEFGDLFMLKNAAEPEASEGKKPISGPGFLKWIADGLVRPVSGSGLRIDPLLETTGSGETDMTSAISAQYDTTLALDWIRNLATAVVSVITGHNYTFETSGVNVHPEQFSAKYTENGGYPVTSLKPIMYLISANETDFFYLGAVRHEVKTTESFVVYNECAAFFPFFDTDGVFHVDVYADGQEWSLDEYMEAHASDLIQLVRVKASMQFFPE